MLATAQWKKGDIATEMRIEDFTTHFSSQKIGSGMAQIRDFQAIPRMR